MKTSLAFQSGNRFRRLASAFSLVEVTISLGIMAFVLTGITGLLSGSYSTTRDSADDNALTVITRNVVEDYRNRNTTDLAAIANKSLYFFEDGSPCSATNDADAISKRALYRCIVSGTSDTSTQSADGTVNLVTLHLNVTWPILAAGTSPKPPKNIYVQVARY